jgi:chromosome segregation ATPase
VSYSKISLERSNNLEKHHAPFLSLTGKINIIGSFNRHKWYSEIKSIIVLMRKHSSNKNTMTNPQPENLSTRLSTVEEQLEQVLDELDLIRTVQNGMRREVRGNSQSIARLERTVSQLAEISARQQLSMQQQQLTMQQQQLTMQQQQQTINQQQENINRILEYLENPNRGETLPN